MIITRKHNPILYNFYINSTPIEEVQATKYLGLTIAKDLSWSTHVSKIMSKALSVKPFLQRNLLRYRKVGTGAEAICQI